MDQPPHPKSGNPASNATQLSTGPGSSAGSGAAPDPSTLETLPASTVPAQITYPGSTALAALGQRYDILGEAGRGAMGQVYKARDRETGEIVALKLLKAEIASDPGMMERFKSELLFARKITHKNVCRVHEFNRVGAIAYTSMEFVEGESLRSVLRRFGSLTQRKGIELALQMCAGLKEAHAQGIVHRDLKPENVMIDAQGNVKIMDFGIARSMEALSLSTGSMIGTPAYMAPEQVGGKSGDYRADIYALGLMLYEMFTGTQPFHADNAVAVALKHMQEAPQSPREIEPSISEAMDQIILKCLAKAPDDRFQSVAELETALRSQVSLSVEQSGAGASAGTGDLLGVRTIASSVASNVPSAAATASPDGRRHIGPVAAILVVGLVALAGGLAWHRMSAQNPAGTNSIVVRDSSSGAPPVSINGGGKTITAEAKSATVTSAPPANSPPVAEPKPRPKKAVSIEPTRTTGANSAPAQAPQPAVPPTSLPNNSSSAATAQTAAATPPAPAPATAAAAPDTSDDVVPLPANSRAAGKNHNAYVWVNRFPREIGAQNAAKRIEDMGLPVTVIPRHNPVLNSDIFVVLSGPFPMAKIDGIIEQLKAKGFPLARLNGPAAPKKFASPGASAPSN